MAVVTETAETYILTDDCSTKNNHEDSSVTPVLPSGDSVNNSRALKSSGNENADTERCERRKKTRRGKPKRKNPYNKEGNEMRKAANHSKTHPRFAHRHADAPYNTNEFLMEDHNSFVNALVEPAVLQPNTVTTRQPRVRDPSFTSVDSDEDNFYSSPEDEEEYLTKEFSNTYEELHVESLQDMSKPELIQQVLQLEEKVDILEKRLGSKTRYEKDNDKLMNTIENTIEEGDIISTERAKQFQLEIGRLRLENEKLKVENDKLQRRNRSSSVSSVDSESDSTTSSPSSGSDLLNDMDQLINANESMDDSREKLSDESVIVDDNYMNEKNDAFE